MLERNIDLEKRYQEKTGEKEENIFPRGHKESLEAWIKAEVLTKEEYIYALLKSDDDYLKFVGLKKLRESGLELVDLFKKFEHKDQSNSLKNQEENIKEKNNLTRQRKKEIIDEAVYRMGTYTDGKLLLLLSTFKAQINAGEFSSLGEHIKIDIWSAYQRRNRILQDQGLIVVVKKPGFSIQITNQGRYEVAKILKKTYGKISNQQKKVFNLDNIKTDEIIVENIVENIDKENDTIKSICQKLTHDPKGQLLVILSSLTDKIPSGSFYPKYHRYINFDLRNHNYAQLKDRLHKEGMIELTERPVSKHQNNVLGTSKLILISKEGRKQVAQILKQLHGELNKDLIRIFHLENIEGLES